MPQGVPRTAWKQCWLLSLGTMSACWETVLRAQVVKSPAPYRKLAAMYTCDA